MSKVRPTADERFGVAPPPREAVTPEPLSVPESVPLHTPLHTPSAIPRTTQSAAKLEINENAYRLTPATFAHRISFGQWIPARHLKYISAKVASAFAKGRARIVISIPPRHGKALEHGTLVLTPEGYKAIEDLSPGDSVTIPNNKTSKIIAVYPQGIVRLYSITFSDGTVVNCCKNHIWRIREESRRHFHNRPLETFLATYSNSRHYIPGGRSIKSIKKIRNGLATCISIEDSKGLFFVTKNNIITHNSELFSVYMPTWILDRDPSRRIMQCAYAAELATEFTHRVRDIIMEDTIEGYNQIHVKLRSDSKRADRFRTTSGVGGVVSAGVGGAITGRGANDLLVDDYMKNAKESQSEIIRQDHWEWFKSTAMTRLEPNGNVAVIATRWNIDDLIGRLKAQEPHLWEFITLKAIAEEDDPLGRAPGEALWPERYNPQDMQDIKDSLGSYWWEALYQQNPLLTMSGLFQDAWLPVVEEAPSKDKLRLVRYWDLAATEGGGDYTVGALLGHDIAQDIVYILDVIRGQWSPGTIETIVKGTADMDGHRTQIVIEQEPGSSGKFVIHRYGTEVLRGFKMRGDRVTGPKVIRAQPFLASAEARKIRMIAADWNGPLKDEFKSFPEGLHDDIVDSVSGAYNELTARHGKAGTWGRIIKPEDHEMPATPLVMGTTWARPN